MDVLKDKIGTVVPNDGVSLAKELGVTHMWHAGNFRFGAKLWGVEVDIVTEPVDEDAREIKVLSIRMEEKHLQKAGVWRRKVGFYYHMERGSEVAENYCELPVSVERYLELLSDAEKEGSEAYNDVKSALETLTKLQGYDKLLGFHVDFSEQEEDGDE